MTLPEASELLLEQARELSIVRAQRDINHVIAVQATHRLCELRRKLDQVRDRYHRALNDTRALRAAQREQEAA